MSVIPFTREIEFEYGKPARVSPLIRRVIARNPGPYTYTGTGTFIVGHGRVAVVDPGPEDPDHLAALLAAVDGETVSHILVTHTHVDHSPLARLLKDATGARVYAFGPHGSGRDGAVRSGDAALDAGGDAAFEPDVRLRHGDVLEGPGWTLESVYTPGHCSNHMSFALREEKALLCGDHVMGWSTSVVAPPDGNMGDYMASLAMLLERDETVYWPSHGPEIRDPVRLVRGLISHRKMREAAILARIREGDRTIAAMMPKLYTDLDPRLHAAAAMSVLAHIEHLMAQGRVVSGGGPALDAEYHPAD